MVYLYLISLLFTVGHAIPDYCQQPDMQDKMRDCVDQLSPMLDKLKMTLTGTWRSSNLRGDIDDFCSASLNCYKALQTCARIDPDVIWNLDGVCDLYKFQSGKFNDCYNKMSNGSYDNCVYSFFMSPIYMDAPGEKQRCQSLKANGKCVKKKTESVCTKDYASDFDDQLDGQLKRFRC